MLLERGADPNASSLPMPVIFFAVKAADIMACEALLAKGADTSIQLEPKVCEINYNSGQKSGDTLHFFILHLVFIPSPPNNVVFCENSMQ